MRVWVGAQVHELASQRGHVQVTEVVILFLSNLNIV